jgi:hypothetical protein
MHVIWSIVAATPTPAPGPGDFDADSVTPGVWGFVLTIAVILAVVVLIVDMVRRIRRVNYRAQVREQLAAEERESADDDPR